MPASPSMYVMLDSHDAVFMKPGSTVTRPVDLSKEDTTMPSLPSVAATTGRSCAWSSTRRRTFAC
ncbi:Uncharacterised protein [Mycobacteroides abscessus]|nr:Uncharacterised protein [Mycobacteroides abscessus]